MTSRQVIPPAWLVEQATKLRKGEKVFATVRELLCHFDWERRSSNAIIQVRRALKKLQLSTTPKFYSVNLDRLVEIIDRSEEDENSDESREDVRQPIITFGMLKVVEDHRELRDKTKSKSGHLGYPKWMVSPNDNIETAAILLAEENIDFVPVGVDETSVTGVIAWDDIATQDLLKRDRFAIKCGKICKDPVFVREAESVYDKKYEITKYGYVLVKDDSGRCFSVVRSGDLAGELLRLTENFLLLQEIENLVRMIIEMTEPNAEEIDASVHEDSKGKGRTLEQLTFSEYKSLILNPAVRARLLKNYGVSEQLVRQIANEHIEHTRIIRNKVLHFHPDENNEQAKMLLSNSRDYLRRIAELMDNS
jgi:predicted transcriptional regulator